MRCSLLAILLVSFVSQAFAAPDAPKIKLEQIVKGMDNPVWLTDDGTGRFLIVEQPGRIRIMQDGKLLPDPYLDLTDKVEYGGECGMFTVLTHPNFQKNGYLYINYTTKKNGPLRSVVSELHADPKSDTVDPATERIILTIEQPWANHNGGGMAFGPDGMLYLGFGDGGSGGDPKSNGQNPNVLLGKFLRIDINQRNPYGIPKDNPFVGKPGWRPEIWALGMRNPWRFSFDRQTGLLYAGDVGQNVWEEIDVITKGGNYGWRIREGTHPFTKTGDTKPPTDATQLVEPIKDYSHKDGISVTGGYVYRGKAIPDLVGWYLYADFSNGKIWGLKYENGKVTADKLLLHAERCFACSFAEDHNGELYIIDHGGHIYRFVADQ